MHVEPTRGEPMMQVATITSIFPMSQAVYTGDEDGKVVSADFPALPQPLCFVTDLKFSSMSGIVFKDMELDLLLFGDELKCKMGARALKFM